MANLTLDRQLARLRTSLAKTPLPGFFSWWGRELLRCLPVRWRDALSDPGETLLLERDAEALTLWRQRGDANPQEFGRISRALSLDDQIAAYEKLRGRIDDPNVRTVYALRGDRTLRRNLTLPTAAEQNLRQVLGFEMDRQTPFKADQVYFDSRVVSRDANGRNIHVELVLVPRAQLDTELGDLADKRFALDGVDIWHAQPGGMRRKINLLPVERRARRRNLRMPMLLGLALLAVVLLGLDMSQSLSNRSIAVESMRAEVDRADTAARQVSTLKQSLTDSIAGANFLAERKRKTPVVIAVLDDITKRLPDDTFLERINLENQQVQMQGQSKEAAKLIALLAESPYLSNPNLQGPIQPDARTGKERFQITADLKLQGTKDTPAEPKNAAKPEPASTSADAKEPSNGS
ncbi:MAG: PilN domain-containing protein [Dokdonella sp.]